MSNNSAGVVNLSAPQPVAYDFESNGPDPVISRNRGSPNLATTTVVAKLPEEEEERASLRLALLLWGRRSSSR